MNICFYLVLKAPTPYNPTFKQSQYPDAYGSNGFYGNHYFVKNKNSQT